MYSGYCDAMMALVDFISPISRKYLFFINLMDTIYVTQII